MRIRAAFFAIILLALPGLAHSSDSIPGGETTYPPFGWIGFCERYPQECAVPQAQPVELVATEDLYGLLEAINSYVNTLIQPMEDAEQWGVMERWDFAETGKGDCDDYVLLKQKLLKQHLHRSTLLVTVVKDTKGEGHAVLAVRTTVGDFILDNMHPHIRLWNVTGYVYVKRQSQAHPNTWVTVPPVAVASVRQ